MGTSTKQHTLRTAFWVSLAAAVLASTYEVGLGRLIDYLFPGDASTGAATPEPAADSATSDTPASGSSSEPNDDPTTANVSSVIGFVGGCEPYLLHAQNRWSPWGAKIRAAPDSGAQRVGRLGGNELVQVDGWVHGDVPYPHNSLPWNGDIWFHLADDSGWVSFAAVRELPTSRDQTSLDPYGGEPPPMPAVCQGARV